MEDNTSVAEELSSSCQPTSQVPRCSGLIVDVSKHQWPIVYSPDYNISFGSVERLQSYDISKWARIFSFLKDAGLVSDETVVRPNEAQEADLLLVHSKTYLDNLKLSGKVLGINLSSFILLPDFLVLNKVLRSFRFQTGGTVVAAQLALNRGWAINLGGGLHHCCATKGGGFCPYADMTLAIRVVFETVREVKKVMIIDLSAHQGNGLGRDFLNDKRVFILDAYNRDVYPHDGFAKRGICCKVEMRSKVEDEEYLHLVRRSLDEALGEFEPDLVVYNAASDVLLGDHTGGMFISPEGIIERDQIVFVKVRSRGIPIVMLTGGGYHQMAARIMADSILNLHRTGLISCAPPTATKHNVPKRSSTRPELLDGHLHEEASDGPWTWFKSLTLNRVRTGAPRSDVKERRTSLSFESLLLKGIKRSLSTSVVDKIIS